MIDAKIRYTGIRPEVWWSTLGSEARVTIRRPDTRTAGSTWGVGLTDMVPLSLKLDTGASDAELDFSKKDQDDGIVA
ncbi:MAG TPA: hypothetical protein GXX40_02285 [Firmicutes bacterium]|nr:hypothetical protein [Bacillota bacterium]